MLFPRLSVPQHDALMHLVMTGAAQRDDLRYHRSGLWIEIYPQPAYIGSDGAGGSIYEPLTILCKTSPSIFESLVQHRFLFAADYSVAVDGAALDYCTHFRRPRLFRWWLETWTAWKPELRSALIAVVVAFLVTLLERRLL